MQGNNSIIGIDVGYGIVGWSIITFDKKLIDYGTITTSKSLDMDNRLKEIYDDLNVIIDRYNPVHAAIESLFFFKNQKTVMNVSEARGVIKLSFINKGIKTFDYTPLQVKMSLTGYGRATKKQIQTMTKKILNLQTEIKQDDAADAVAIAVTHIFRYSL